MTDMDRYPLSKPDFDCLDDAFGALIKTALVQAQPALRVRAEKLRYLFAIAHAGQLELEPH